MKAVLCKNFGLPDTLVVEDLAPLVAEPGKVVVSVKACSVNFPDALMIQNMYQFKPPLPFSPGGEVSGVVKEVGEGVRHLKPGDRVVALCGWGGFAEELLVDAKRAFPIPPQMNDVLAASVLYNYGTSYHALKDRAQIKSGETLLVLAAAGGVGLAAVELGVMMGAKVIAAASSDEKLEVCKKKGAFATINYATEDLRERIKSITDGKGVDVVYDPVGDKYAEPALRSVAWGGRYLVVGFAGGTIPQLPLNLPLLKGCAVVGVFFGQFAENEPAKSMQNIQEITMALLQGKISPHIHHLYTLSETPQAIADIMQRKVVGKAVVVTSQEVIDNFKNPPKPAPKPQAAPAPTAQASAPAEAEGVSKKGNMTVFKNLAALKSFSGKSLGVSDWQEVTQEMINNFAAATLDFQWIHVDEAKAKKMSPFGTTIAHGFLTLSLAPKFFYELFSVESSVMGINYGAEKIRLISPVPAGSKVRMKATLKNVDDMPPGGAKLLIEAVIELEGSEKPACVAELISIIRE